MNLLATNEPEAPTDEPQPQFAIARDTRPDAATKSAKKLSSDREPATTSLFRVVWRWHFYAGVIVTPVLMTVALTGGIYIFGAEVHDFVHRDKMFVTVGSGEGVSYAQQIEAAVAAHPGHTPTRIEISDDASRATVVSLKPPAKPGEEDAPRRGRGRGGVQVYVDPSDGSVVGALSGPDAVSDFFRLVLDIHRRLFLGTTGRVIVELATCWTIMLLVSGLYLWWPRRREKVKGVWIPRLSGKLYVILRDLHSLAGAYLLGVAIVIAGTGLIYTFVWGNAFLAINDPFFDTGENAEAKSGERGRGGEAKPEPVIPPKFTIDQAIAVAQKRSPDDSIGIAIPANSTDDYAVNAGNDWARGTYGRMVSTSYKIGRDSGEVTGQEHSTSQKFWWHGWTYPLHVGSVFGMTSKLIWLLACLSLAFLPVTGLWMWWKRRPKGKTGFPRRPERTKTPLWVWTAIVLMSVVMPVFGASALLILLFELSASFIRRRRASRPQPA